MKILKMENHLNAVLVLYTKKTGFATCIFDRKRKLNFLKIIIQNKCYFVNSS